MDLELTAQLERAKAVQAKTSGRRGRAAGAQQRRSGPPPAALRLHSSNAGAISPSPNPQTLPRLRSQPKNNTKGAGWERVVSRGDSARVHRRDPVAAEAPRGRRCGRRPHLQPEHRRCGERCCGTRPHWKRECRGQTAKAVAHGPRRAIFLGRVSFGEAPCALSASLPRWIVLRVL